MFAAANNIISALASLLGRKDESNNLHQPEKNKQEQQKKSVRSKKQGQKNNREPQDQPEIQPEKKKKKEGKKNIEKEVIDGVILDFLSSYVDQDKTNRKVIDLSNSEIEQLRKKLPDINNWLAQIDDNLTMPASWRVALDKCKVKQAFMVTINALKITLEDNNCPLFNNSSPDEQTVQNLLSNYSSKLMDFKTFESHISKVIDICNSDESLWKQAIIPFQRKTIGVATEQELTRNVFAPLFNFTSNFSMCEGNANCSIEKYTTLGSISQNVRSKIPSFHPDDFVVVKYGNDIPCVRLIREDAAGEYYTHTNHKDFITIICEMRLTLASNVRRLIRNEIDVWHDKITTLGITTDSQNSYLYSMHCNPKKNSNDTISITNYFLNYLGAFSHSKEQDRIQLIAKIIIALANPPKRSVEKYLSIHTHISSVNTDQKPPAFPKLFKFYYPTAHQEFVTYSEDCKDTKYAKGKVIKKGTLSSSVPVYVKYNNNRDEVNISSNLNFATLYLCTSATDYCISLAGSPLSHFVDFGTKIENVKNFTFDIIAQLFFLEKSFRIHNDVKPENIVLYDNHWFLIDYEISHEFDLNEITKSKSFSKGYRSPERKETFVISPKSDIYSLGLVILEVLEEKRATDWESTGQSEIFEKCDKFKDFPLCKILKKMLYSDVNERSSPVELVDLLISTEPELKETLLYFENEGKFNHLLNYESHVAKILNFN